MYNKYNNLYLLLGKENVNMDSYRQLKAKIPCKETGIEIKRTLCDICSPGVHCGIDAYVKDGKVIKIEGTKEHPMNKGLLCTKGLCNREYIYREDRIKTPLKRIGKRSEGKFKPISWDEAYREIAEKLNRVKSEYGAKHVAFFTGYGKWYRPFLQRFASSFGSPNYGTESSSCSTSAQMAGNVATGRNFTMQDMENAKTYLGWGFNPYYSKFLNSVNLIKLKEKGLKFIIVDPRITPTTQKLADLHLRIKPGTDGALALGMANLFIQKDLIDREYIEKYVHGFNEYKEYVKLFDLDTVSRITGVSKDNIVKAVEMLSQGPFCINESAAPIVHHQNGFQNYRAMMSLSAITGNYDRIGGNIPKQDYFAGKIGGFQTLEKEFVKEVLPKNINERIGGERFPLWNEMVTQFQAMDLPRQIEEKTPYEIRALFCHGINARMFPNSGRLFKALHSVDFFVNIDLFMTDTSKYADILLPACTSFEREECKSYPGGYITYTKKVIDKLYDSKSDVEILSDLANVMNIDDDLLKAGYEASIRHMFKKTCVDVDKLKESDLPLKCKDFKPYIVGSYTREGYDTSTSRFELKSTIIEKYKDFGLDALPTYRGFNDNIDNEYTHLLTSGARISNALHSRLHDIKLSRILKNEASCDISSLDAKEWGVISGDYIKITTKIGSLDVKVNVTDRVLYKNIHMYHGYRESDINSIIDDNFDPYSGFPAYRSCKCKIEKMNR
ncbi:molybdopterin-dependent oxidoreductase [Clostridioides difficile]|nr:molybdopterin-dependent oxidoreductase [Clostridioides difficile]HBF8216495.1 molybdopterin-dependent oxidoreductase [Clostridioides difficile]HBF8219790.1 molybdopterin-dependent oxidoreductase [Clostridioides difficile]HBF8499906.1 molybdopterin-dependent oxidoreductase [Clostridioides difficile]HBF8734238.1 molybdopterin-dependent oxidoreductase [Clostridioides difficile]